jgi:hypothetical protein
MEVAMTSREFSVIILTAGMLISTTVHAQIENSGTAGGRACVVTTRDGLRIDGVEIGWNSDTLLLLTPDGVHVRVPSTSILTLERLRQAPRSVQGSSASAARVGDGHRASNALNRTKRGSPNLFITPTGYPESAWETRLGLHEIFFPTAAFGIAGYGTIQAGTSVFPDVHAKFLHGTVKVTPIAGESGAVSAGATWVKLDDRSTLAPFLIGTVNAGGASGNHITVGVGYQVEEEDYFLVSGIELPVSESFRIMTELFLVREGRKSSYVIPGMRFQAGRFDIDVGVILPLQRFLIGYIPWIGASVVI